MNEEGISQLEIDILFFVSDDIGADFELLIDIRGDEIDNEFRFCAFTLEIDQQVKEDIDGIW